MSGPYQTLPTAGVPVKIWTDEIEPAAMEQLYNIARLPFVHHHVAAMPDVHFGIGATVGSVIATKRAIVPAAVGVDIGCGMIAARLNLTAKDLPDSLREMRDAIERAVPVGSGSRGQRDNGSWEAPPSRVEVEMSKLVGGLAAIVDKHRCLAPAEARAGKQLGTLGGGNHFIEVCLDKESNVWLMLHSGSRGIGNTMGRYFIEQAKEEMERWHITIPHADLAYLPEGTKIFNDYVQAVEWAQGYAARNREVMLLASLDAIAATLGREVLMREQAVNCHHNYVQLENHFGENVYLTRKGAVSARLGELGIIPGSMGAKSYIVRGKGNPESFHSCSHGAGRRMSRTKAKEKYNTADVEAQTAGVECRKDAGVIDEIPAAYKDIDKVMAHQSDLVEVVAELKQILCIKG